MRWTASDVANFNVNEQIDALNEVFKFTEKLVIYRNKYELLDKKIKKEEKIIDFIRNGFSKPLLIIVSILVFLILEFLFRFIITIILCIVLFSLYFTFFSDNNRARREELAEQEYNKRGAKLWEEKEQLLNELEMLSLTDEGKNATLLLPDEFLFPEKVAALINILKSHNAKNIKEAMEVYNMNK